MRWILVVAIVVAEIGCKHEDEQPPVAGSAAPTAAPTTTALDAAATPDAANDRPTSVTDEMVAKSDALLGHVQAFGKALAAAGTDCKQATAAAKAAAPAITAALAAYQKVQPDPGDEVASAWLERRLDDMLAPMGEPFLAAGQQCRGDKDFVAAMKALALFGMGDTKPAPPPAP